MDIVKQNLYKYPEAPPILELEEHEKFKDKNGKTIEIEVRGERNCNNCFFKVKDISIGFEMPSLQTTITGDNNCYIKDIDYKTFNAITEQKINIPSSKIYVFMTYEGIIKLLYISRNTNAKYFRVWATEKLFAIQLGTQEQKEELASNLIGVNPKTIKDVFDTNTSKTPCIYLFLIGRAGELLEGTYDENDLLCKYGCSADLPRRTNENSKLFQKEFNKEIELLCFSIIEAQHIFDAESNIRQYFSGNLIEYKSMKELIIINKKELSNIKQHFRMIQTNYIGRFAELNNKIHSYEKEIIELNTKLLVKDKDTEIMIEKHKNELKDKDIEILQIKLKFYEK